MVSKNEDVIAMMNDYPTGAVVRNIKRELIWGREKKELASGRFRKMKTLLRERKKQAESSRI